MFKNANPTVSQAAARRTCSCQKRSRLGRVKKGRVMRWLGRLGWFPLCLVGLFGCNTEVRNSAPDNDAGNGAANSAPGGATSERLGGEGARGAEVSGLKSREKEGASSNPSWSYGQGLRYLRAPKVREIKLPEMYGANAIWGATGRDHQGHIYFGVASAGVDDPSARLLRYAPKEDRFEDLGSVNSQLDRLKLRKNDPFPETQMKIHSKIYESGDGRIYFSSQDEHGETSDGSKNALFGGRLFSMDINTKQWECPLATAEGLIATAAGPRYVYSLGYFGHVVYQYDTKKRSVRSIALGTYRGHVSRNLFTDYREHCYAIRLKEYNGSETSGVSTIDGVRVRASLVELDTELLEVSEWPLEDYQPSADLDSHGLTGFAKFTDGNIVFVTHSGALWRLVVGGKSSKLERLGWAHPEGPAACESLFAPTGKDFVMGFTQMASGPYEWFVFDVKNKRSTILRLSMESREALSHPKVLVYGGDTLDDSGRAYVAGWKPDGSKYVPAVFQLSWDAN